MKKLIVALVIGAVCLLGSSVFAAMGSMEGSSGSFNLPGLWSNYSSQQNGDSAWAFLNIEVENCIPGWASWNFYAYSEDPSKWNASLHVSGWYLGDGELPDGFEKNQSSNIDFSNINLSSYLGTSYSQREEAVFGVYASYGVSPASIDSANFFYHENQDSWQNLTRWSADYYITGHFIADTLAEAQIIGTPFIQTAPEPATICLLGLGVVTLLRRGKNRLEG